MRTYTANQQTVRDATEKETYWLFDISPSGGGIYYFSTVTKTYGGEDYIPKIDVETFDGITFNRNRAELGSIAPTEFEFDILNIADDYTASDLVDAEVLLSFVQKGGGQEEIMFQVKFIISDARDILGRIHCKCDDLIQNKIRGYFPNDKFARSIFPSNDMRFGRSKDAGLSDLLPPWTIGTGYPPLPYIYVPNVIDLTVNVDFVATSSGSRCQITRNSGDTFATLEAGRNITITDASESGNNMTVKLVAIDGDTLEFISTAGFIDDSADEITITQDLPLYLLGDSALTYTVTEVRSPYDQGRLSTWDGGDYTFSQFTVTDSDSNDWKGLRPIIMDANKDGTADATGQFTNGAMMLPIPASFARNDLSAKTDPTDALEMFLEAIGVASGDIDAATQASVKAIYTGETDCSVLDWTDSGTTPGEYYCDDSGDPGISDPTYLRHGNAFLTRGTLGSLAAGEWDYGDQDTLGFDTIYYKWISGDPTGEEVATNCGIALNGSLFTRWDRNEALAMILNCSNIILDPEEKIKFRFGLKASQKTIDDSYVLTSGSEIDSTTFNYQPTYDEYSDSAEAEWFGYITEETPAISTITVAGNDDKPSGEFFRLNFLNVYKNVCRAGRLVLQKKYGKKAEVDFFGKSKLIDVQVGDVITISENDYGGAYAAMVDKMHITPDGPINFSLSVYSHSFDDWADLNPQAFTVPTNDGAVMWEPAVVGPQSDQDIGVSSFNVWSLPYLIVGPNTNSAPYTSIQQALNDLVESRHRQVMILNGEYTEPDIYLPFCGVTIFGENKTGVVLKNTDAIEEVFQTRSSGNYDGDIRLTNFTIQDQDTVGGSTLISLDGGVAKTCKDLIVDNLIMSVFKETVGVWHGNIAISIDPTIQNGRTIISNNIITGGETGIKVYSGANSPIISDNILSDQSEYSIYTQESPEVWIERNKITEFWEAGIYVYGNSSDKAHVNNNDVTGKTGSFSPSNIYGILIGKSGTGLDVWIKGNRVTIINAVSSLTQIRAFDIDSETHGEIIGNKAIIDVDMDEAVRAFNLNTDGATIQSNISQLDNVGNVATTNYGFVVAGDRNVFEANKADGVNNAAADVGIYLPSGCDNNSGYNFTYRVGTSISDLGASNAVTAKDV